MHVARPVCETGCVHGSHSTEPEQCDYSATDTGRRIVMSVSVSAYSKCVPRTNCALRIKTPKTPTPKGRGGPRKIVHPEKILRIGPGVCVSLCLFVRDHIFGTTRLIFSKLLCMLPRAVVISYLRLFPILRMTSYLLIAKPLAIWWIYLSVDETIKWYGYI